MNILVCNDDGIFAPGLAVLAAVARRFGDVTVVAPASAQSAMGHSITLTKPLTVTKVSVPDVVNQHTFAGLAVDGRPADCVRLAVRNLVPAPIDLVLSGINPGANVGINVFYSGTVAAAAEATMMGIPAVAISMAIQNGDNYNPDFVQAGEIAAALLDKLLTRPLAGDDLININLPDLSKFAPKGICVCQQSDAEIHDTYISERTADGLMQYHLGADFTFNDPHHASDAALIELGYTTVTPLQANITNHNKLDDLKFLQ